MTYIYWPTKEIIISWEKSDTLYILGSRDTFYTYTVTTKYNKYFRVLKNDIVELTDELKVELL